jgi:uncharacterized protein (TIGR00725 family)
MNGLSLANGRLYRADALVFDCAAHRWVAGTETNGAAISATEAVTWLLREGGGRRLPVSIIGPREADGPVLSMAEEVAATLADIGFPLICGGRGGAMEAASRGCARAGGIMLGILPSDDWREANPHVTIPIATGIGEARNSIIASASFALIAVGGAAEPVSYGTISEMAFGLRLGRLVLGMPEAPDLPGMQRCKTAAEAAEQVALRYLALD